MNNSFTLMVFLTLGLICIFPALTEGFKCYKCSSKSDDLCIEDPTAISSGDVTVECTGYCTILRTEFTDIPGQAVSFVRDCEKKPLILNEIRTDAHYTKYYTSCTKEKCNSGDGIFISGSGGNSNLPSSIMLVPEITSAKKSASTRFTMSTLSLAFCICFGFLGHLLHV